MKADLFTRLETHARLRAAHNASPEELALLTELAATLPRPPLGVELTHRQTIMLGLLLDGESVKASARRMGISPNTAKDYVKTLHRKYNVRNRHELTALFGKALPRKVQP